MKRPLSIFHFSFLRQNEPFLKQGDLTIDFIGKPLKELIFLNSDELEGVRLDKYQIPAISKNIYQKFVSIKDKKLSIKNSKITLFIYTLCRIDELVLFLVWHISTEISHRERNDWEQSYGLSPGLCCKKNYLASLAEISKDAAFIETVENECFSSEDRFISVSQSLGVDLTEENSQLKIEKNCKYKLPYVECRPIVFSHLLNYENPKALDSLRKHRLNIQVNSNFRFSGNPEQALFSYGYIEDPSWMHCNFLYDKILFENKPFNEHQFLDFLGDSLLTCFNYQKHIRTLPGEKEPSSLKTTESRLLYMSVYL